MYFIKTHGKVWHILEDEFDGRAPAPCGARAEQLDLSKHKAGEPTANISAGRPADVPLCKHCEKAIAPKLAE